MKLDIFKQKWIDMVFEGRNKSYGAYELRKKNPKVTMIALLIGALFFSALLALPMIDWGKSDDDEKEKVKMVDMANLPPPPPPDKPLVPPPPPPPPAPKIDEVKFVPPKVVKKEEVVEEIKTIEELKDKNVGAKDVKGQDDGRIVVDDPSGDGPPESKVVEDNTVYNNVEIPAEFPGGGLPAFYEYVKKKFRVPEGETINGNIIVTFVVEKDGSLTDIKVLRDLGYGTGKEAERLLRSSPKWKPGVQNGRSVRSRFNLPIKIVQQGD
ncbi:MAG: energy transducer TonB [Flavobacterium sp. BFFFF1]|uniref:energy transducer TonB n=1 Tax=unclassified Flavobacterium TaxID=196869 RepID=UPI000BD432C9|nr:MULTISPECIES: energy transducer TonB [unclassified Flavobacterium]OYU79782.1 MAG: energy transducer TonB [Flavobacterium sp. BFFFF1]